MLLNRYLKDTLVSVFVISLLLVIAIFVMYNIRLNRAVEVDAERGDVEVLVENLRVPWDLVLLPDGSMLITQRNGILVRIGDTVNYTNIDGVVAIGEGGLLGVDIHPEFESNRYIYLYLTVRESEVLINRVVRYSFENDTVSDRFVVVDDIPAGQIHNGGMIRFGPDNLLYITTGDAGDSDSSQNLGSLGGKILRVNDDGTVPDDNPFNNSIVYSYGHRNSQGLVWDSDGNLWSTEHGRSGILSGYDEVNMIEAGGNYGWPVIQGSQEMEGMITPVIHSGATTTWAPSGIVYHNGYLFFGGLRGESLYQLNLENLSLRRNFNQEYGRIRSVVLGSDDYIYFSTSNLDGRGNPVEGDDRIVRVRIQILLQ